VETDKACLGMDKIAVKVHNTEKGAIIAACDVELLGKKLKHGEAIVEIRECFYFDRHIDSEELAGLVEGCMTANIIGKKAVEAYCKANLESKGNVISVGGVPHLIVFRL